MKGEQMRIVLRGRSLEVMEKALFERGITPVNERPDIVLCHGGDGALLGAEREFPGVPKLPIRDIGEGKACPNHEVGVILDAALGNALRVSRLIKLRGRARGDALIGINEILVHNFNRVSAIRYKVWIDDEPYIHEVVGDGVCVATPHGATAYYRSITHSVFRIGIGLAFSNSTEPVNHLVLPDTTTIRVEITRGPALMVSDNSPRQIRLDEGDEVLIEKTTEQAEILGLDIFMCPICRKLRHLQDGKERFA